MHRYIRVCVLFSLVLALVGCGLTGAIDENRENMRKTDNSVNDEP
jgi:hypothetical protein